MNMKVVSYFAILLVVGVFLGMAVMKFTQAKNAAPLSPQAQAERLQRLENSPAVTSPAARNFINRESAHRSDTNEILDQTSGK